MQRCVRGSVHAEHKATASLQWQPRRGVSSFRPADYAPSANPFESPKITYELFAKKLADVANNSARRKVPVSGLDKLPTLLQQTKEIRTKLGTLNSARNKLTEKIKTAPVDHLKTQMIADARQMRNKAQTLQTELMIYQNNLRKIGMAIPNWTHKDVPVGSYKDAKEISTGGPEPLPMDREREHTKIAADLDLLDLIAGTIVTGNSWYYLLAEAVALEQALVSYALSVASANGWNMVTTPDVIKADLAWRCGFQPREDEAGQTYFVETPSARTERKDREGKPKERPLIQSIEKRLEEETLVLSGTAEIPLAGLFAFHVLNRKDFPIKVVGVGKAFRAEAGARGSQTRGLYRVHQFTKVELFALTNWEDSEDMMERMLVVQKEIIDGLGIPYRVLDMPTEELGASAWRKYDIEAWMPGRGQWGEICSLSNCTEYQSRRLLIQYVGRSNQQTEASALHTHNPSIEEPEETQEDGAEPVDLKKPRTYHHYAHTLNGTAAAIPRLIIALLENGVVFGKGAPNERKAVALRLPECLRRFWIGPETRVQWVPKGELLTGEIVGVSGQGQQAEVTG